MRQHYYFKMEDVETLSFVDFFELLIRKAVDPGKPVSKRVGYTLTSHIIP